MRSNTLPEAAWKDAPTGYASTGAAPPDARRNPAVSERAATCAAMTDARGLKAPAHARVRSDATPSSVRVPPAIARSSPDHMRAGQPKTRDQRVWAAARPRRHTRAEPRLMHPPAASPAGPLFAGPYAPLEHAPVHVAVAASPEREKTVFPPGGTPPMSTIRPARTKPHPPKRVPTHAAFLRGRSLVEGVAAAGPQGARPVPPAHAPAHVPTNGRHGQVDSPHAMSLGHASAAASQVRAPPFQNASMKDARGRGRHL